MKNALGWVYVISNPSILNRVKIGYSMKDPRLRAKNDFDPAGLPDDYDVEYMALVEEPRSVEQRVHALMERYRDKKEWFNITAAEAVAAIKECATFIEWEQCELEKVSGDGSSQGIGSIRLCHVCRRELPASEHDRCPHCFAQLPY